jgi:hypothetical protein
LIFPRKSYRISSAISDPPQERARQRADEEVTVRPERRDETLFTDHYRYVLGPFVARAANGDWLVTWNMSTRLEVGPWSPRTNLHPPCNPEYRNYLMRSRDAGRTWEPPRVVPGFEWTGTEHVALCVLENGEILASFYQRKYFPLEEGLKNQTHRYGWYHRPPYPSVVTHGGTYVHRSHDDGLTWEETVEIDSAPFISAYSPRNIVVLDRDTLLFAAGAADPMFSGPIQWGKPPFQVRNGMGNRLVDGRIVEEPSRAFVCISRDGGHTWRETREIAAHPEIYFVEPTLIRLQSGRLLCHMRNCQQTGHLWQVASDDGGETWSEPSMTPMWGYPAHIVQLGDGRVLSVYGHRRKPYGIRACLSRDDLVSGAIGYPVSMVLDDDTVVTVFWDENADGETSIVSSTYQV